MDINGLLMSITIASLSINFYLVFFKDMSKNYYIDHLTGAYNRHYLDEIEELEKSGEKFYVVFADIDHFKSVNDNYGHDFGDIVLKVFSKKLKAETKGTKDFLMRYGGEEFIFFFNVQNKDLFTKDVLKRRVDEIRKDIELMAIENNGEFIKITSSFGICSNLDMSIEDKIANADKKLYEAKEKGRNIVMC